MRVDLHVHTHHSAYGRWRYDAIGTPRQVLEQARRVGMDCIAITDHDTVSGAKEGIELARSMDGITVIPGVEVSSADGHILALGVLEPIRTGLTAMNTVETIHDRGGVAVAAHPFRSSGVDVEREMEFDLVEVWNARTSRAKNERAAKLASDLDIPVIGASDAHHWKDVGRAHTVVAGEDVMAGVTADTVELIRGGMSWSALSRLYSAKVIYNLLGRTRGDRFE